MGNTTILDILGSTITFGLLFIMALKLNASTSESSFAYNSNFLLQRNMVVLTVMIEEDLRHVGVGAAGTSGGILIADTTQFRFRADLPPTDGVVNIVEYKLGALVPNSPNPKLRYLSRIIDGTETKMNLGVTEFKFRYWNIADPTWLEATPVPAARFGSIGPVEVSIKLESPYKMKQDYMQDTSQFEMLWRQIRSISRNNTVQ
jgi:hypothetical protein